MFFDSATWEMLLTDDVIFGVSIVDFLQVWLVVALVVLPLAFIVDCVRGFSKNRS